MMLAERAAQSSRNSTILHFPSMNKVFLGCRFPDCLPSFLSQAQLQCFKQLFFFALLFAQIARLLLLLPSNHLQNLEVSSRAYQLGFYSSSVTCQCLTAWKLLPQEVLKCKEPVPEAVWLYCTCTSADAEQLEMQSGPLHYVCLTEKEMFLPVFRCRTEEVQEMPLYSAIFVLPHIYATRHH